MRAVVAVTVDANTGAAVWPGQIDGRLDGNSTLLTSTSAVDGSVSGSALRTSSSSCGHIRYIQSVSHLLRRRPLLNTATLATALG